MLTPAASAQLRRAYHDLLLFGIYAREKRIETQEYEGLHLFARDRLEGIRKILQNASVAGNPQAASWFTDAERLLVAYFDNAARIQHGERWPSLMRALYTTERLGQEVFERIQVLAGAPLDHAPREALEVFQHCLSLGYHGAAPAQRMDESMLRRFKSKLDTVLQAPAIPLETHLRPLPTGRRFAPRFGPVAIVISAVGIVCVLLLGTELSLYLQAQGVLRDTSHAVGFHDECK